MVNLELKVNGYNCYDQVMSSVLAYFDCAAEYPVILTKRWWFDFDFENTESCIGGRITIGSDNADIFTYVTGIRKNVFSIASIDEIWKNIKETLETGKLITAIIDEYYSPWNPHYRKLHTSHAVIIVGIDINKEEIYCSDRYYGNKIETVDFSVLSDWLLSCTAYEAVAKPRRLVLEENERIVHDHIQSMYEQNVFGKIRQFADYIQTHIDLEKEFFAFGNIENTPFVIALNMLGYGRESFSKSLDYIKIKHHKYELDYFVDAFGQIGRRWRDLGLLICKYIMTQNKNFNVEKMVKLIKSFADQEEALAEELMEYLKGHPITEPSKFEEYDWGKMSDQIIPIDVSGLLNNRAFAQRVENAEKANFNDSDEFMVLKDKLEQHALKVHHAVFPVRIDDFSSIYDNFACDEQTFEVPNDYYKAIYAVVTAQYVNQSSIITVEYTDGSTDVLPFCVTDWRTEKVFGEQIAYEAVSCKIVNDVKNSTQGNAYLFLQGIELDRNKVLLRFTLPYHPNIHVFALAVGK